jgi:hypothetical protein
MKATYTAPGAMQVVVAKRLPPDKFADDSTACAREPWCAAGSMRIATSRDTLAVIEDLDGARRDPCPHGLAVEAGLDRGKLPAKSGRCEQRRSQVAAAHRARADSDRAGRNCGCRDQKVAIDAPTRSW